MGKVEVPQELRQIYIDYLSELTEREAKRKPTEGLMGFGKKIGDEECHGLFSARLEEELGALADKEPSSETAYAALFYVYDAPLLYNDRKAAYWMLIAVHTLTDRLVGFLSQTDAADLSARYNEAYPRYARLPAQKRIAALLQSQAGPLAEKKKKGLSGFFGRN